MCQLTPMNTNHGKKIESMIQKKTPRNKTYLVRRLVKLEYKDGHSMIEHLKKMVIEDLWCFDDDQKA